MFHSLTCITDSSLFMLMSKPALWFISIESILIILGFISIESILIILGFISIESILIILGFIYIESIFIILGFISIESPPLTNIFSFIISLLSFIILIGIQNDFSLSLFFIILIKI